jgi:hypothetical protein
MLLGLLRSAEGSQGPESPSAFSDSNFHVCEFIDRCGGTHMVTPPPEVSSSQMRLQALRRLVVKTLVFTANQVATRQTGRGGGGGIHNTQVDDSFCCPVCLEAPPVNPQRAWQCDHDVCGRCLRQMRSHAAINATDLASLCPLCRAPRR